MHAYCLFCETQRCGMVAELIETRHDIRCISPQIIQRKWVRGVAREEKHSWLPGYVFLYSDEPIVPSFEIGGIIRWLGRDELKGSDLAFAQMLYQKQGVLGTISLAEVGDRCVVHDPAWESMRGTVVKLDRGRKRCCVAFEFDGQRHSVWLGYELVSRDEDSSG